MSAANEAEITSTPIDVVVYLNNNTGLMLSLQGGQDMRADQLFELVLQEMKVGGSTANLYRNTFSLWFVSDLLELQLKPSHIPFKLMCFWEELLEKYVQCSEEAKQRDEPMIMFQRNVYMSKQQEPKIKDEKVLRLLYEEAHSRVVQGRYPLEMDVLEECAVLQAMVMEATGTQAVGSSAFFLNHLKDLLPAKHCRRNWLWRKSHNIEHRLATLYHNKTQSPPPPLPQLYHNYLSHCHKLALYGSAFLHGQVENVVKKVDDAVLLCISLQGVALISCIEQTIIASIPFDRMSWQYAESSNSHESNTLPCLFLLFQHFNNDNKQVNKLLQIFSKSAILADNLIDTFISLKKTLNITLTPNDLDIYVDDKKVALAVFDESGRKLRSSIRAPKDKAGHHPLI